MLSSVVIGQWADHAHEWKTYKTNVIKIHGSWIRLDDARCSAVRLFAGGLLIGACLLAAFCVKEVHFLIFFL